MAHKDWCKKDCYTCEGCELEMSMPCYPCCDGMLGSEDVFKKTCLNCTSFSIHIDNALGEVKSNASHAGVIKELEKMCSESVSITDLKVAVTLI